MENNLGSASGDDMAREALADLDADGTRLAERVTTPWWYHLILGAIFSMMVFGISYPGAVGFGLVAVGVVGIPVLVRAYTLHAGVWISRAAGPATRRLQHVLMVIYMILMGAGIALRFAEPSPWWALLPALAGLVVTCVLGRHYDHVLRRELAAPGTHSRV